MSPVKFQSGHFYTGRCKDLDDMTVFVITRDSTTVMNTSVSHKVYRMVHKAPIRLDGDVEVFRIGPYTIRASDETQRPKPRVDPYALLITEEDD